MTHSLEFRTDINTALEGMADARGCVHVYDDGRDPAAHTPGDDTDDNTTCMPDGSFAEHADHLRWLAAEAAARIDALTDAVEQLHAQAHRGGRPVALCALDPCRGLYAALPGGRGTVPL